jgi:hypothetical protein
LRHVRRAYRGGKAAKTGRGALAPNFFQRRAAAHPNESKLLFCGIGEYQRVTSEKNLGKRFLKISLVERLKYDGPDIVRAVSHFVNVFVR